MLKIEVIPEIGNGIALIGNKLFAAKFGLRITCHLNNTQLRIRDYDIHFLLAFWKWRSLNLLSITTIIKINFKASLPF